MFSLCFFDLWPLEMQLHGLILNSVVLKGSDLCRKMLVSLLQISHGKQTVFPIVQKVTSAMAWHQRDHPLRNTHRIFAGIPPSLKWMGILTLILVMPGGLILWGAQEVVRWRRGRASPSAGPYAEMSSLEFEHESENHADLEKKAISTKQKSLRVSLGIWNQ